MDTVIPIGLILNELISNSLKYAFIGKEDGELQIILNRNEKELFFSVRDNGCGFPSGWKPEQTNSLGYKLIQAFAKKLKARLNIENVQGACVSFFIPGYKLANESRVRQ